MRAGARIAACSAFIGLLVWLGDAAYYWRLGPGEGFTGALWADVPGHRMALRFTALLALAIFGWTAATLLGRQRSSREELRRVADRLNPILDTVGEGVFGIDLQGRITFANRAAARPLGHEPEQLVGRDTHALVHHSTPDGEPRPREECPILGVLEGDEPRDCDELFWSADGESVPVRCSATSVMEDGNAVGAIVVFRVRTEAEATTEELERLTRLSQLILTWAGEGVCGLDRSGRITFANPAAAVMLGYDAEELTGRHFHELVQHSREDGRSYPQEQSLIYAAFEDDDVYHVSDEVFWRSNGESFPVEYTSTPLREGGEVRGAVVVFQDITERKSAERELRRTLDELERSNRELEQFAYVVSHDLQEPLRMVHSYVELLRKRYGDDLDEDAREFIDYAVDGATRMQRMIEDLLRYSRVGSRGGDFESIDLDEVLDEALANLATSIEEADAEIRREELPTANVDRAQMVQVFQNLISNAIKFRGDDRPRVHVSAEEDNGGWLVSVSDNGIGIPADQMERIFAIFQRLHGGERYPGTGIGLSICKKIVERHGGDIRVEAEPGEGTTFSFSLPARATKLPTLSS